MTGHKLFTNYIRVNNKSYEIISDLGHGFFSQVKLAKNVDSTNMVAIKLQPNAITQKFCEGRTEDPSLIADFSNQQLQSEIAALKIVDQYLDHGQAHHTDFQSTHAIIMKFISGKSFSYPAYQFSEEQLAGYLLDLIQQLCHLHKKNYLHLDIGTQNILVDKSATLIDFSLAHKMEKGGYQSQLFRGTHLPPEIMQAHKDKKVINYNPKTDFFALGMTFYELLFIDRCNFKAMKTVDDYVEIYSKYYKEAQAKLYKSTKPLAKIILAMTHPNPEKRTHLPALLDLKSQKKSVKAV